MNEQLTFLFNSIPNLLFGFPGHRPGGLIMSILLALVAAGLGFVLAIIIGSGYESRRRPLRVVSQLYVTIFRGLPLILLLLIVHQLLGSLLAPAFRTPPLLSAFAALTLFSGAYQAEIVRAGLQAVPEPLVESARLLGSNRRQAYRLIKLRYCVHVMWPAFTGQAISLFKDTSVVVILGVAELMTVARITLGSEIGNSPYWLGLYLLVGLFYFLVAFTVSHFAQRWERAHQIGDLVHSLANY